MGAEQRDLFDVGNDVIYRGPDDDFLFGGNFAIIGRVLSPRPCGRLCVRCPWPSA
jgi:hypothetical protein